MLMPTVQLDDAVRVYSGDSCLAATETTVLEAEAEMEMLARDLDGQRQLSDKKLAAIEAMV